MSDPFRRVRPGEAVRITATAWNALMDMVRPSTPTQGNEKETASLPATVATLTTFGIDPPHSPSMGEAVVLRNVNSGSAAPATTPFSTSTTFTSVEAMLWSGHRPLYRPMAANTANLSPEDAFAICIDPPRMRFAVGGLAWVRVRTLRQWHRFARRCIALPTDGAPQLAAVAGCLDSCGWGPAEILGYAPEGFNPAVATPLTDIRGNGSFTAGSILWALVRM
jgi:hypothetical protein